MAFAGACPVFFLPSGHTYVFCALTAMLGCIFPLYFKSDQTQNSVIFKSCNNDAIPAAVLEEN